MSDLASRFRQSDTGSLPSEVYVRLGGSFQLGRAGSCRRHLIE